MARGPLRPGDWYVQCERTGFKIPASQARREWTGAVVRKESWDARHPLEFVRARIDRQSVPDARPRVTDVFTGSSDVAKVLIVHVNGLACVEIVSDQVMIYRGSPNTVSSL